MRKINDLCILKTNVSPSQPSPESCLTSRVAVKNDGTVIQLTALAGQGIAHIVCSICFISSIFPFH